MKKCHAAWFAVALVSAGAIARAQSPPLPPAKPAAVADVQRLAFLAMPEADRKAIQDALGWLGLYNGVIDGGFGKRTIDAILAYQTKLEAPPDGIVTAPQLAAMKAAAQKLRAAVGFQSFDDAATGIRIGAPLKLLDKTTGGAGETRLSSRDGAVTLVLSALPAGQGPLAELYKRLGAETPDRKITYKAMKADAFFVIAGEAEGRKFYQRYAQGPAIAARGFVFTYPLARAEALDPIVIAIANAFEPFPAAPTPTPAPSVPALTATALVFAPGQAVTALRETDCRDPTIGGKAARFLRADASGLAVLGGEFGAGAIPVSASGDAADLIVLSLSTSASGGVVLEAADAPSAGSSHAAIVASLTASARGAPVFDRRGGLAALIAPMAASPRRVAGVTLAEPHGVIDESKVASLVGLGAPDTAAEPLRAADLALKMRGAIVGIFCAP